MQANRVTVFNHEIAFNPEQHLFVYNIPKNANKK